MPTVQYFAIECDEREGRLGRETNDMTRPDMTARGERRGGEGQTTDGEMK